VGRDAIEVDLSLEFGLEPALERVGRGLAHLVMHEQHVLAPLDRLVARAEDLVRRAEKPGPLETFAHDLAQAGEAERDAVLLAIIAELDHAYHRRAVEARNRSEVEHNIPHRLFALRLDDALDALEQPVRRSEEDKA